MEKHTILIVDDEPINLTVLSALLSPYYRVLACKKSEDALRALRRQPKPDLVLLDIVMPGIDGYGLLRQIRQDPRNHDIPVIFISALDSIGDEEKGFLLGAVDYITKPLQSAIVLARVKAHLELKESRDRLQHQNEWLEVEVTRRLHENQLIQDATLTVITQLAESRDCETGNHILRTRGYVEVLARNLQKKTQYQEVLNEQAIVRMIKASPLHDIGKIGISDAILLKPGKLSAEEFSVMKKHCQIGGLAIRQAIEDAMQKHNGQQSEAMSASALLFLKEAEIIAMYHHEKWDGSGYPEGLRGEEIPLSARIMALADVFDALTCRRVYKEPWTLVQAIAYIKQQKGLHFSPEIVEVFLEEVAAFTEIYHLLADAD